jgi:hypothetical protein
MVSLLAEGLTVLNFIQVLVSHLSLCIKRPEILWVSLVRSEKFLYSNLKLVHDLSFQNISEL